MSVLGSLASLPETAIDLFSGHGHKATGSSVAGGKPVRQAQQSEAATSASGADASGSSSTSATNIGTTFLSLLVKELQNQDPTAPMDSTAMVGQMISLNQLDQLIAIHQAVQPATAASAPTSGSGSGHKADSVSATSSSGALAARAALQAALPPTAGNSSFGALSPDATLQAAAASASNTGVLNLNGLNSLFGGK